MADSSLLPVLAALGGVALAQGVAMIQSWLDRENKREILLRTKYEELANQLNDSLSWAMAALGSKSFESLNAHAQPLAARKTYTLCLLYFPLLKPSAGLYVEACVSFQHVLTETFVPHETLDAGAQAAKNINTKFQAAGETLRAAREAFDSEIQRCASVYIKS